MMPLPVLHVPALMAQALLTIVGLVALDTLLGWVGAIVKSQWDWHRTADFLRTAVVPYVVGVLSLAALGLISPDVLPVFYAAAAAATAHLIADVVSKIAGLGVPVQPPTPAAK